MYSYLQDADDDDFESLVWYSGLVAEAVTGRRAGSNGFVRVNCPVCAYKTGKADRKACLGYAPSTRRWSCWKCGARGRLSGDVDVQTIHDKPCVPDEVKLLELPEGHELLSDEPARSSLVYEPALRYVLGRVPSKRAIRELRIGACLEGRFAGRVILPVYDTKNVLRWYVGRSWKKKAKMPYLYPRGARDGVVFNEAALDVETDSPALIVEGMFDAYALWPHAVAVLGKTTDTHLARFRKAKRPIVLVPDGDAYVEGLAQMQRLRMAGIRAGLIKLPPRKDPDEMVELVLQAAPLAVNAGRYVEIE